MTTTLTRPNRYAASCIRCRGHIPAGGGLLARTDTGAWAADHDGPCPDRPMATATPAKLVEHDGIYQTETGAIYKVQIAKNGSGRLYAKRLDPATGTFTYAPGAIHNLRDDQRMTREAAAAFGKLYGICCACGRDLTDEGSIAAGIGPICSGKYF